MYRFSLSCLAPLALALTVLPAGCPQLPSPNSNAGADDGGVTGNGQVVLTGRLNPGQAAKRRARMQAKDQQYPFTIVAQSDQTGAVYRTETDQEGNFELPVPQEEVGNSFVVTILGPDGRAVGPVVFGTDDTGQQGITGLAIKRDADLGTIDLPDDPTATPINPGADGDANELVDPALSARLNAGGAPVGLESVGKGADTLAQATRSEGAADTDQDGLIDLFDADDDGNGVIDDLDKGDEWTGVPSDIRVNFFMNLKISAENAQTYYAGTPEQIAEALSQQTVITFEVMSESGATRTMTEAYLLETPGPSYLPIATVLTETGERPLWKDSGYAFTRQTDRFDAFVLPNAVMDAGDTFTVALNFDDGSTVQVSRMINYIFKSIPALVQYGAPEALTAFDINNPAANGSPTAPLPLDGTQDLVLVFRPPPDETGSPITGLNYSFQLFFNDAQGTQLNGAIDKEATWPTPVPGWTENPGYSFDVSAEQIGALSEDGTYTATLPREIFADQVVLTGGGTEDIASYKIDITACAPTGNAALMVTFVKQ